MLIRVKDARDASCYKRATMANDRLPRRGSMSEDALGRRAASLAAADPGDRLLRGRRAVDCERRGFRRNKAFPPTPACDDHGEPTLAETEGPYFKPHSPRRADLRTPGISGHPVELSGLVLTRSCRPVRHALVDLWHADDKGVYDNQGFGCAAMCSPTRRGVTLFAPCCRGSIRAAPATITSRSRRPAKPC